MTKQRWILLVVLVAAIGAMAACAKRAAGNRRGQWHGLSESEARAKLDDKLPHKIPADKRDAIKDKVVGKMREKGVLADEVPDDISGITDSEHAGT